MGTLPLYYPSYDLLQETIEKWSLQNRQADTPFILQKIMTELKQHRTAKQWLETVRYWSFPMSLCPVVATIAYLSWSSVPVDYPAGLLAVIAIVFFQAGGNLLSDYRDYRTGVDSPASYGVDQLVKGLFSPREYLIEALVCFVVAILMGIYLVLRGGGLPLLLIGTAGLLLAVFYSRLKALALGDLDIFLVYAVLAITGTSYAVAGTLYPSTLVLTLPIGLITVAVLHANNTRDITTDRDAGIHTLAMLLGHTVSIRLYVAYIYLPFLLVAVATAVGLLPLTALACLLMVPLSYAIAKGLKKEPDNLLDLDQKTALLQLGFSGTLILGIIAGLWI